MLYTEILKKLKSLHINLENAKALNETQRMSRYKRRINDLEQKKLKAETENTLSVLREQEKLILKLEKNLESSLETQKISNDKINSLEEKFAKLLETINPTKTTDKPTVELKTSCPKCEKWFTEKEMTEHQETCKANKQW